MVARSGLPKPLGQCSLPTCFAGCLLTAASCATRRLLPWPYVAAVARTARHAVILRLPQLQNDDVSSVLVHVSVPHLVPRPCPRPDLALDLDHPALDPWYCPGPSKQRVRSAHRPGFGEPGATAVNVKLVVAQWQAITRPIMSIDDRRFSSAPVRSKHHLIFQVLFGMDDIDRSVCSFGSKGAGSAQLNSPFVSISRSLPLP